MTKVLDQLFETVQCKLLRVTPTPEDDEGVPYLMTVSASHLAPDDLPTPGSLMAPQILRLYENHL